MPLTPAQLATLKANIAANANTIPAGQPWTGSFAGQAINTLPNSGDANAAIAGWYNLDASPNFFVWRDLPMEVVAGLHVPANMTPLGNPPTTPDLTVQVWIARCVTCQGKQLNFQSLTQGRTVAPMKRSGYRAGLQDCLTNVPAGTNGALISAGWVEIRDAAKFLTNNIERLFATGTGSQATPGDLVFEGFTNGNEVEAARNLP